tara:strand:- start:1368 stop:2765 length:1398 start_codon:yes stop_codon:yes gene_type:complete
VSDFKAKFQSRVTVSPADLFKWHTMRGAFNRLTPPWQDVTLQLAPDEIIDGTQAVLEFKLGPIRRPWVAEHFDVKVGEGFSDSALHGPFPKWEHVHTFLKTEEPNTSVLSDEITYRLPLGWLGAALGRGFARKELERLFWYRHEVTRLDAERHWAQRFPREGTILITGSSGLVGRELTALLQSLGYRVRGLTRSPNHTDQYFWSPQTGTIDEAALEGVDAVVHLAGAGVADKRWSKSYREEILRSRELGTRLLAETMAKMTHPPKALICASGANAYPLDGNPHDETGPKGDGFLSQVVEACESSADAARDAGIRVAHLRLGVVLTPSGGALKKMLPAFIIGAGGPIGTGEQAFSWIGLHDALDVFLQAIEDERYVGPINVVAPHVPTQKEFAKTLGKVLRRPAIIPLPAGVVRTLFGNDLANETLLADLHLVPQKLKDHGYDWRHENLEDALRYCLGRPSELSPR